MRKLNDQRGDTLIEVIVAFAVFAMVAVGALNVMNQGTATAQDTLETTHVRQQIDNQAEILRYLHQAYLANPDDTTPSGLPDKFRALVDIAVDAEDNGGIEQATPFGNTCTQAIPGNPSYRFMLNPTTGAQISSQPANNAAAPPYAQVAGGVAYGLWIEPILSNADESSGTARYIDFHIRACWNSASASPQRTLGTIVRLYVPANVATGTVGGVGAPIPGPTLFEYSVDGSSANPCFPHRDLVRNDGDGNPGFAPFEVGSIDTVPSSLSCQRSGAVVYNCSNYDAQYGTGLPSDGSANANYEMTINYNDADCGDGSLSQPFTFRVAIYKDGTFVTELSLSTLVSSRTVDVGDVNQNTKIQLRWWNNHPSPGGDPDFAVSKLTFKRT